jgi:integrase
LAAALVETEQAQLEVPVVIAAIRLLILTGCRVAEIVTLRWQEVDFDQRCLRLSDSKTGRKTVYLNTAAIQILGHIDRSDDSPYVIRCAKPESHLADLTRPWFKIRHRAGLDDVRLHDIRHTYASYGAGMGLSLPATRSEEPPSGRLRGRLPPSAFLS